MELQEALVFFHVLAAATWFGAHIIEMIVPSLAVRQGMAVEVGWLRITVGLAPRLYFPSVLILLGTGIALVLNSPVYTFGSLFVTIGLTILIVATLIGVLVLTPGAAKAADELEAGDQTAARARTKRLARLGALETFLLVFAFAVMLARWTV